MWPKLLLLFFAFSFIFRTDHSFDQDLGRHLKLGEIIVNTHQVPKVNLFSYTNPDFPFINTHWLFEVVAYFFSQTAGLHIFLVLKIVIFLLSLWLIMAKQKSVLLLPIGFIFFHVLRERLELRPEIFSFLFTALTFYILEKNKKSLIYILPFIQLLWINTHIYFFVGLIMQAIFIIHRRTKLLITTFVLSILASLLNPSGIAGILYPLNVTKNYGYNIVENQTLFFLENIKFSDPNFLFVKLSWGIITLSLVVTLIRKNFDIKNILLTLAGLGLSLINVRSFPYLVFLSLPGVISMLPFGKNLKLINKAIGVILIWESFSYLNGQYYRQRNSDYQPTLKYVIHGEKAMDFVLKNDLPGPIFNNFDIGSYIIYRGYPKYRTFVDGRPEAYPAPFFNDIYIPTQANYQKFKEAEKEYNFQTVIFSHTDQTPWGAAFLENIVKDESWKLVYIDDFIVIFTKKELPIVDLDKLDPKDYLYENHVSYLRIGLFLLKNQHSSGQKFIEKANSVLTSGRNNQQ